MDLIELDRQVFIFINSLVGKSFLLDWLARLMVNEYFVTTTLSLVLLALWFYWNNEEDKKLKQKSVIVGIISVGLGSLGVVSLINNLVQRVRPFDQMEVNLLFYKPTDPSFPSNAAVVAFSLAAAIYLADKKLGVLALALASFYGFLRVFVGIHFPADVIAGALIGVSTVVVVQKFDKFINRLHTYLINILKILNLKEVA